MPLPFTAEPGSVTGFLGPNGAGKSTTMRVMVGLAPPTSGSVTIDGRTGRETLVLAQETMGLPRRRVDEMLERVSLTPA